MSEEIIDIPIHQSILASMKEAILFVNKSGRIIQGNKHAYALLKHDRAFNVSIDAYLDFDFIKSENDSNLLMELKNGDRTLVEVKRITINDALYCLILHPLSFKERSGEIKKHYGPFGTNSTEGMVVYTDAGILHSDDAFNSMFGYTGKELKNLSITDLLITQSSGKLLDKIRSNPDKPFVLQARKKSGEQLYVQGIEQTQHYNGTLIRIGLVKDITEQVEKEKRMEYLAFYDELTDLPNRNFFVKVLKEEIELAEKNPGYTAVYYLDLDYYKEINETAGYTFSDELLKVFGTKLKTFLTTNTFIAKVNGDEFIIMQHRLSGEDEAIDFAKQVIAEFEKPVNIDGYEIYTTVSIGISLFPENGINAEDLIRHAKAAMQVIKKKHHNNYKLFETSISENFKSLLTMESALRKALKKSQFEIHYQPQKNVRSGKIVGLEALLRWNHPTKGKIPPMDFIPLAEQTGLIVDIGDWVIYEACKQNKRWQEEGYGPVAVSVNLSAVQLRQKDLIEKVEHILQKTGLEAKYLELEITESMSMANEKSILATINGFHKLGVNVSIDDFGTGYSSLKYLSLFPITKLKIDKMFMDNSQEQNQAIVKSIIHLSHALDMKVIAEGVETHEQFAFLEKEKCDEIQGFYFSKPLPPDELNNILSLST